MAEAPSSNRTETWNEVRNYSKKAVCYTCGSIRRVKTSTIKVGPASAEEAKPLQSKWKLCEHCHEKGWQVPGIVNNRIVYHNSKTGLTMTVGA